MLFRLSFGGKTHPAIFSTLSEMACDMCNDVADTTDWHPEKCKSWLQDMMGPPAHLPSDIPIAAGQPLAVAVKPRPHGYRDVYLDDMIQIYLDTPEHNQRAPGIVPLVLDMMVRPKAADEPVPRNDILAADKMAAEGDPAKP